MNGKHILLAEDDPCDAQLTLSALEDSQPNTVTVVQNGEEALDYLYCRGMFEGRDEGNPTTILLDLKMPKIDGLDTLKIIKADEHLKSIPVVMLTSSRQTTDLSECYEHGANAYVVKPMDCGEFAKVVGQIGAFWTAVNEPPPAAGAPSLCATAPSHI